MSLKPTPSTRTGSSTEEPTAGCFVLGGGHVGDAIARRLRAEGRSVSRVDETHDPDELPGVCGDPRDLSALEAAGVSEGATVVVAMAHDSQNLLVAQLVRAHFDVQSVHVLVNDPDQRWLFTSAGHEPVCATSAASDALVDGLTRQRRDVGETA